ncbi:MAG: 2-phospho-L-lactate transferase [Thermoleophilaceae bacterium]|jgi:LPPG:FO 2-phospho-L-lactate transferase|nr:2-phospho-L-lactate transferase [Thermoleophilaceae bacterium]
MIVLLSGGTGGAKLARGLLGVVGAENLVVIANTGDDTEAHGVHVSPDPDLVAYWLADLIDERGYGIRGDTWQVMEALEQAGRPAWFRLGDRDLAMCLVRTEEMRRGERQTAAHAAVTRALGLEVRVLPMSDAPVRTHVEAGGRVQAFQEFMILGGGAGQVAGVEFRGADEARPSPEALAAIAAADVIVIGPSNPIASIGPILALPGMRAALAAATAPVVAVSPFVGGQVLKGPTEAFCDWAGLATDATGVAEAYGELLTGLVADERVPAGTRLAALVAPTLMDTAAARREVARTTLEFAESLRA